MIKTATEQGVEDFIEREQLEVVKDYFNGEDVYWCFDKERSMEVRISINWTPDEEVIENFEENLKEQNE